MKKLLSRAGRAVLTVESVFLSCCLLLMLILILAATFARILGVPFITWSEELARTLMVWLGLIGSGVVIGEGNHFSVNFVYMSIRNEKIQRAFFVVIQAAVFFYGLFIMRYGWLVVSKNRAMGQLSPALQTPMWISYLVLILFGAMVAFQSLTYYMPLITGRKKYTDEDPAAKPQGTDAPSEKGGM